MIPLFESIPFPRGTQNPVVLRTEWIVFKNPSSFIFVPMFVFGHTWCTEYVSVLAIKQAGITTPSPTLPLSHTQPTQTRAEGPKIAGDDDNGGG